MKRSVRSTDLSRETVQRHCGRWDIDILSGWEVGVGPRRRIGGRLYDHLPPDHLAGQRLLDWLHGYERGKEYRAQLLRRRTTHFVGATRDGREILIKRKGWAVDRGRVVDQMARRGVMGDVMVYFFDGPDLVKRIRCGI